MPKIYITRQIPDEAMTMLQEQGYTVAMGPSTSPSRTELLNAVKDVDAILSILTEHIDAEVMDAAGKQLKIVANYAVGFDNVDVVAAKTRNIVVTNTPVPEVSEAVAEHAMSLIMALAHRICEGNNYAKAEKYAGWNPQLLVGTDVSGKTLGIIGLGRIGKALAERAVKGFKMKVIAAGGHPERRSPEATEVEGSRYEMVTFDQLLQQSDFISLHVPLSPETRHMISTEQFSLMKKTAFLINTARGPVVDEKALLRALKTQRIAGAALDVFECEPSIDCDLTDKLELKAFSNVILTPHIASATVEARNAMARCAAENIIAVFSGKPALNPAA